MVGQFGQRIGSSLGHGSFRGGVCWIGTGEGVERLTDYLGLVWGEVASDVGRPEE
ncbi:MAG: hypothetical protein ACI8Y4_000699 [Candidatus Poriferisodalaceae bacterium]|jgi:hypothetical protein